MQRSNLSMNSYCNRAALRTINSTLERKFTMKANNLHKLLLCYALMLTTGLTWAECSTTIIPQKIAPKANGGIDVLGSVVSSNCACTSNGSISFDTNAISVATLNRDFALIVSAKMAGSAIIAYSQGTCVPNWYVGSAVLAYFITAE